MLNDDKCYAGRRRKEVRFRKGETRFGVVSEQPTEKEIM